MSQRAYDLSPFKGARQDIEEAEKVIAGPAEVNISIDEVTRELEEQGIDKFIKPYDSLLETLENSRAAALQ